MKNNPLIVGLLVGLIVVLVVAGVSILTNRNSLSNVYKQELARNISLEKTIEDLRMENTGLKGKIEELNGKIDKLGVEIIKLEKLKEKLEDNLKEELMKQKLNEE